MTTIGSLIVIIILFFCLFFCLSFPEFILTNEWRIKKIVYDGDASYYPQYKIIKTCKIFKDREIWSHDYLCYNCHGEKVPVSFESLEAAEKYVQIEKNEYNEEIIKI